MARARCARCRKNKGERQIATGEFLVKAHRVVAGVETMIRREKEEQILFPEQKQGAEQSRAETPRAEEKSYVVVQVL